jgi:hypothetical protein
MTKAEKLLSKIRSKSVLDKKELQKLTDQAYKSVKTDNMPELILTIEDIKRHFEKRKNFLKKFLKEEKPEPKTKEEILKRILEEEDLEKDILRQFDVS